MTALQELVIKEAMTWIGTPYHDGQLVKGVGADCATFPMAVYKAAGLVAADYVPPRYRANWFMVKGCAELYVNTLINDVGMREITEEQVQPADYVLFKFCHAYSHGAIVVSRPEAIHCSRVARIVSLVNWDIEGEVLRRPRRYFTFREEQ
jgi:cell wall-associated NlpC family hydrolase